MSAQRSNPDFYFKLYNIGQTYKNVNKATNTQKLTLENQMTYKK